jgi:TonB family protein
MGLAAVLLAIVAGFGAPPAAVAQELPKHGAIAPLLVREVQPPYPEELTGTAIEGTVRLECIVREDGTTGSARVIAPVHPVLDSEALKALGQWRFLPGRKDGRPVPVRVEVEITFLRESDPEAEPKGPPLGSPEVHLPGGGVTQPTLLRETKPSYTAGAMRAGVQGRVKLECVVLADGAVGDVRVLERLHPDLDAEALRALRKWRFKPGIKDGVAVPVRVDVEMTFTTFSGLPKLGIKR